MFIEVRPLNDVVCQEQPQTNRSFVPEGITSERRILHNMETEIKEYD
jgi:hypothetical protein